MMFACDGVALSPQYSDYKYDLGILRTILKQYLIKGYAIDRRRLDHYDELKDVVRLMSRALTLQDKVSEGEYSGLFCVIADYVYALDTLDRYDYQSLRIEKTTREEPFRATYDNAMRASVLPQCFSCGSWRRTAFSIPQTDASV